MMVIWKKVEDEYLTDVYYSLIINDKELAYLWYDYYSKKWFLSPTIFKEYISKKAYKNFGISEKDINEVQFNAALDLLKDLNDIMYDCEQYCEAINNFINKHLQEEICNED